MLLTCTSGFVDLIGYVALLHLFTANMTGNTVHLGRAIANFDLREIVQSALAVATFMLGLLASRLAVDVARRIGFRRIAGAIFLVEAVMLAIYGIVGVPLLARENDVKSTATYSLLLVLLAGAMGLQNAAMTHFGPLTVRTTHVTGTLAELAEQIAEVVIWIADRAGEGRVADVVKQPAFREMVLLAGTWCFYLAGAIVATAAFSRWKLVCIAAPIAALLFLVGFDSLHPMIVFEAGAAAKAK